MTLDDLMALCQDFHDLGWAVAGQLVDVADGGDMADQNPNALRMCQKFLREAAGLGVDGVCWDINEDEVASVKPTRWKPLGERKLID